MSDVWPDEADARAPAGEPAPTLTPAGAPPAAGGIAAGGLAAGGTTSSGTAADRVLAASIERLPAEAEVFVGAAPRRRRTLRIGAGLAVVCAAAGVSAGVVLSRGPDAPHGLSGSPRSIVLTAADRAATSSGARIDATVTVTGLPAGTSVDASGSGLADPSLGTSQLTLTLHGSPEVDGMQERELSVGGRLYLWTSQFAALLPRAQWVQLPTSDKPSQPANLDSNPVAGLQLLREQGNTVTPTGAATVDGQPAEGYDVQLDLSSAALRGQIKQLHLPTGLQYQTQQFLDMMHGFTVGVFIGEGDRLLRMTEQLAIDLPGASGEQAQAVFDFHYLASAVHIAAPAASSVATYEQLERAAQASGVSGSDG